MDNFLLLFNDLASEKRNTQIEFVLGEETFHRASVRTENSTIRPQDQSLIFLVNVCIIVRLLYLCYSFYERYLNFGRYYLM